MSKAGGGWSHLLPDLLAQILSRLEVDDFIRFRAVCVSWRSVPTERKNCRPKPQIPWLLVEKPEFWCFLKLSPSCFDEGQDQSEKKIIRKYEIKLPQIAGRRFIGSSQGFLITVDDRSHTLSAINPLTGAHLPLPSTATHPDLLDNVFQKSGGCGPKEIKIYYQALLSPSLDAIAVATEFIVGDRWSPLCSLAIARAGGTSWTCLMEDEVISNMAFHKGHLYVLDYDGQLRIFDLDHFLPVECYVPYRGSLGASSEVFLVESPDGDDLFSVHSQEYKDVGGGPSITRGFEVCKLGMRKLDHDHELDLGWNHVRGMGEFALLFDRRSLMSMSTRKFPNLRRNCIYSASRFVSRCSRQAPEVLGLEDGSIQPSRPIGDLKQLHLPASSAMWFAPAL